MSSKIVNEMIHKGCLKTDAIIDAFADVPRVEFMPKRFRSASEADIPIPLGYGHMMPSPSIIANMLELLDVQKGHNVLIAGFGSGWVSALLCHIVGQSGHVTACDVSHAIEEDARANIAKFSFIGRDHIIDLQTVESCKDIQFEKKFDRVIVLDVYFTECNFERFLTQEGILVMPRENKIHRTKKTTDGKINIDAFQKLNFLPPSK